VLWALAIGTRLTLVVPIGTMTALLIAGGISFHRSSLAKAARRGRILLPIVLGLAVLGWYNLARFGSITETGLSYALSSIDMQKHKAGLFGPGYVIPNLYNYLLKLPRPAEGYPFVRMDRASGDEFFSPLPVPDLYYPQPVVGLLAISPFILFALLPVASLIGRRKQRRDTESSVAWVESADLNHLMLILYGAFVGAFAVVLMYFWVAARFLGDFLPALTVLAAIGFWQASEWAAGDPLRRRVIAVLALTLAGCSVVMSTLLALSTNATLIK
jgi:hypothetical protein